MITKFDRKEIIAMAKQALTGPIASVSIPFAKNGDIDYDALKNTVDFIVDSGSGTVLLTYGDSLYSILTDSEVYEVTKVVVEHTANRAMTVVAGSWWMGECVRFAKFAYDLGADMYMALPPNWTDSSSVQGIVDFYTAISAEIPTMIVTSMDPTPVPYESIKQLLEQDNGVVALKDDKCGAYGKQVASLIDGRIAFLSGGRKINHLEQLPFGIDGYLSVFMRFCPSVTHDYWSAVQSGDMQKAVSIIQQYDMPFFDELVPNTGLDFDAVIHASMEVFGVAPRYRRIPYQSASDEQMETVRSFFTEKGLL